MIPEGNILPTKILVQEPPKTDVVRPMSGIIIPEAAQKEPCITAKVIKTGEGLLPNVPMVVKEGQWVIFGPHSFQRLILKGQEFKILDVRDVLFFFD